MSDEPIVEDAPKPPAEKPHVVSCRCTKCRFARIERGEE